MNHQVQTDERDTHTVLFDGDRVFLHFFYPLIVRGFLIFLDCESYYMGVMAFLLELMQMLKMLGIVFEWEKWRPWKNFATTEKKMNVNAEIRRRRTD